jgi:hypothetical protein
MTDRLLQPAVRAYTPGSAPERAQRRNWRPDALLVLDTETEPTAAQSLLFLSYRLVRVSWDGSTPLLSYVEEGLAYGDGLADRNHLAYEVLDRYRQTHAPAVDQTVLDAAYRIRLRSRAEFVDEVLYPAAVDPRGLRAWVVSFAAGWDLSRLMAPHLAVPTGGWEARPGLEEDPATQKRRRRSRPGRFTGGFSLPIWEYETPPGVWHENRQYRPRLGIRHLGTRKNLTGWIAGRNEDAVDPDFSGHLLDALTLSAAVTGVSQTLESACEAFGFSYQEELDRLGVPFTKSEAPHGVITPEYISYNRADTAATARLCAALLAECAALGIETQPTRIYSTASIAKDTLDRLGVQPLLARQPDFDPSAMGFAMTALFGGRSECHIRRTHVPITYVDFTSMYPTVSILLGLQDFLTCARVDVVDDDPAAVEQWLGTLDVKAALRPETWSRLRGIALIDPRDDVLSVRTDWHANRTLGIGLNRVASAVEPLWYGLPDLVASTLLSGHAPRILRVLRFVPSGVAAGLRPMHLGASIEIDLRSSNLYRALIEERARVPTADGVPPAERERVAQFLKIVANSLYGITAEMNPRETGGAAETMEVHGLRSFALRTSKPEEPGDFFFAPQAALTTAGGRLMLALLERLVTDAGGTWCFADTDSFAIVSSADGGVMPCPTADGGGRIRALSFAEVNAIRDRIGALNPYDRLVVPDLLKLEKVNFEGNDPTRPRRNLRAYAVAAKKYVLFVPDPHTPEIVAIEDRPADEVDDDRERIVDRREHGLGFLRNPIDPRRDPDARDWVTEAWAYLLAAESGDRPTVPPWFGRPKMSRNATLSTPRLLRAFGAWNKDKTVDRAVKPFNFLNRVFVDPDELPERLRGLTLAAPYNDDPATWLDDEYFDLRKPSGPSYRITTDRVDPEVGDDGSGRVRVETYGDLVHLLPLHPESKSLGPDGRVCGRQTHGELSRRTVVLGPAVHVGKESTQMPEGGFEGVWATDRVLPESGPDEWTTELLALLRDWSSPAVARCLGVNVSTVKRWKAGRMRPHPKQLAALAAVLRP